MRRAVLKRKPSKGVMGSRPDTRVCERHKKWVRGYECLIAKQHACEGRIEFAHVRFRVPDEFRGGTGLKPNDAMGVPLCSEAHREQHQIGEPGFAKKYGVDLVKAALHLARRSPHLRRMV